MNGAKEGWACKKNKQFTKTSAPPARISRFSELEDFGAKSSRWFELLEFLENFIRISISTNEVIEKIEDKLLWQSVFNQGIRLPWVFENSWNKILEVSLQSCAKVAWVVAFHQKLWIKIIVHWSLLPFIKYISFSFQNKWVKYSIEKRHSKPQLIYDEIKKKTTKTYAAIKQFVAK